MKRQTALQHVQKAASGSLRDLGAVLRALVTSGMDAIANVTDASIALTSDAHAGLTVVLNRAAGSAVTLPDASGTGAKYTLVIGTSVTSNTTTIKVGSAADSMIGHAFVASDGDDSALAFEIAQDEDTITLNGSTTGGIKGDQIEITDIGQGEWLVKAVLSGTGTEATPFSATVA